MHTKKEVNKNKEREKRQQVKSGKPLDEDSRVSNLLFARGEKAYFSGPSTIRYVGFNVFNVHSQHAW